MKICYIYTLNKMLVLFLVKPCGTRQNSKIKYWFTYNVYSLDIFKFSCIQNYQNTSNTVNINIAWSLSETDVDVRRLYIIIIDNESCKLSQFSHLLWCTLTIRCQISTYSQDVNIVQIKRKKTSKLLIEINNFNRFYRGFITHFVHF